MMKYFFFLFFRYLLNVVYNLIIEFIGRIIEMKNDVFVVVRN